MTTLIIIAHPSPHGFVHKAAAAYAAAKKAKGDSVDIVNLYDTQYHQDFLRFEDPSHMPADPIRDLMHQKMRAADEYAFFFPLWWFDMPAILKNWLDTNFSSGFAFKYQKGSSMPLPLLKGKIARLIVTADGPGWFYALLYRGFLGTLTSSLRFCGIRVLSTDLLSAKRKRRPEELQAFIEKVARRA